MATKKEVQSLKADIELALLLLDSALSRVRDEPDQWKQYEVESDLNNAIAILKKAPERSESLRNQASRKVQV